MMIAQLALTNTTNYGGQSDFTLLVPAWSSIWVSAAVNVRGWMAGLLFSSPLFWKDKTIQPSAILKKLS